MFLVPPGIALGNALLPVVVLEELLLVDNKRLHVLFETRLEWNTLRWVSPSVDVQMLVRLDIFIDLSACQFMLSIVVSYLELLKALGIVARNPMHDPGSEGQRNLWCCRP